MKEERKDLLTEAKQKFNEEQEAKRHSNFIRGLEGKKFSELNIREQSYLYENYRKTYDKILNNKQETVRDIEILENLKTQEKEREKSFEELKPQEAKNEAEAKLLELINKSIDDTLKKYGL